MFIFLCFLFLGLAAYVVVHLEKRFHFLEYLFFCRYPLLVALTLAILLPASMLWLAEDMLGNLAKIDTTGIVLVAFFATVVAWFVMFTSSVLLGWIFHTNRLDFYRHKGNGDEARPVSLAEAEGDFCPMPPEVLQPDSALSRAMAWFYETTRRDLDTLSWQRLGLYILIALPIIGVTVWKSTSAALPMDGGWLGPAANIGAALIGIALAVSLRFTATWLTWKTVRRYVPGRHYIESTRKRFHDYTVDLINEEKSGKRMASEARAPSVVDLVDSTFRGIWFFALVLILFVSGYWWSHPDSGYSGPALLLVLLLLVIICTSLTLLSAIFDRFRVPVLLVLVAGTYLGYELLDIDHHYPVIQSAEDSIHKPGKPLTPRTAYHQWRDMQEQSNPVMVVVTASGGGITAARWTAEVLSRMQEVEDTRFDESLVLISSVSGGGVGSMYYLDRFANGYPPTRSELREVERLSGKSSLAATAWGLVYRDLWQILPLPDRRIDRGWALEQSWARHLTSERATLRGWRDDALGGKKRWRPIPVFNATVTETGERFLLTPMHGMTTDGSCGERGNRRSETGLWKGLNFLDLYPYADISVATAARLSATFPFVSPIARPQESDAIDETHAYHIADGGYYDNHGVATAIDFLRDVLPLHALAVDCARDGLLKAGAVQTNDRPAVVLIQIRAGNAERDNANGDGFRHATLGPMETLMKVRTSTQVTRNDVEVELLANAWAERVDIASCVFNLGDVEAPLSWHLTKAENNAIDSAWNPHHQDMLEEITAVLARGGTHEPLHRRLSACTGYEPSPGRTIVASAR